MMDDFVKIVQRGNAAVNGKQQAFTDLSEIYAKALKEIFLSVSRQVNRVMETAGCQTRNGGTANVAAANVNTSSA